MDRSSRSSRIALRCWQIVALSAVLAGPAVAGADEPPPTDKAAASKNDMTEARRQFEAGISLLEDPESPRYEEAYNAFKRSYELSHSAKVLGNIALCAFYLERDGEAVALYTSYLQDVPKIEEHERRQIERDLATLRATIATVTIRVKGDALGAERPFLLVDRRIQTRGNPVENAYALAGDAVTIEMRPGRHTFVVRGANRETETGTLDVTIQPASSATFELELRRPVVETFPVATAHRSLVGPVVLGALGLAAIGAGVGTGLAARGTTSDIEGRCPNDLCPASYDALASDRSSAKTLATIADASYIGGGVLLGGALLWYALLPAKGRAPKRSALLPAGSCAASGCRVSLRGEF